ncbi:endoplasmic reticulum junction formation protein lunapark-B-like [Patiria miniata]|uniref:Endoplasmic reticulum junction formation protein lunapark n=1 Tax=Patiria miniata TaxID=46514 RepID=A0A914BS89_PATMI|nr:endoplasmic reticulum junction formation protein lunapark-B-like [Patiria miniata]
MSIITLVLSNRIVSFRRPIMGSIISRIWRKKSTMEQLEAIEKKMEALLSLKRRDTQREKQMMGSLLLYSVIVYLLMALFFYFYYEARDWKGRATQILPFLLFPVLIFGIRKLLQWYYVKRIARNQMALEDLRAEKKTILEEVKDKESYKKAKEILDRFDPSSSPPPLQPVLAVAGPKPGQAPVPKLRQRPMTARGTRTPNTPPQGPQQRAQQRAQQMASPSLAPKLTPQQQLMMRPQPPRPILPRERGTVDKLVDFLVGDGPSSRYALICRHCYSHNGMALQEEFEYLAFKCAYCGVFNPSKKVRPQAPQLPVASPSPRQGSPSRGLESTPRRSSTSEGGSQSDSDVASTSSSLPSSVPKPNTQTEGTAQDGGDVQEGAATQDDESDNTPADTHGEAPSDTHGGEMDETEVEDIQGESAS